ncbi:MAG: ABC transporter permease subunit [Acetivibrionales bacterium]|jgi:putative aldouronate transport system permease protein
MNKTAIQPKGLNIAKELNTSKPSTILHGILRICSLILCLSMFFPGLNPARISNLINRNISLFTTGLSFSDLTTKFNAMFRQGAVDKSTFVLLSAASVVIIVGTVLCGIGGCMSLGNNRMKLRGIWFPIVGSLIASGGLVGIYRSYLQLQASRGAKRAQVVFPSVFYLYIGLLGLILLVSLIILLTERRLEKEDKMEMPEKYSLFLMLLPIIILAFIFLYLPLYGWRYSFFDYKAGGTLSRENFVGFKWFTILFRNPATVRDIVRVLRNTLVMSGLGILTSWVPMAFAILLNEIRSNRFKRLVQTVTTIPNFISWVLVYAIALAIFSTEGFLNSFLELFNANQNTNWLMNSDHMWTKMLLWGMWKSLGWSAIVYIAAIAGIDQELYEAAKIDGAGRFQRVWHITVPGLMPTYLVLLLLTIAGALSNGLEQYLMFQNANNKDVIEVLDLYVYNIGIDGGRIPLSTVIGMSKSLISITLLLFANRLSKFVRGEGII